MSYFLWFLQVWRISSACPNLQEIFSTYAQEIYVETYRVNWS